MLPVIQYPDLQNAGGLRPVAAVMMLDLIPAENTPNTRNTGHLIPQYPFFSNSQFAKPLTILFEVLVYHGKQLLHRWRFIRIRKLIPNGLGQTALFRTQGIP